MELGGHDSLITRIEHPQIRGAALEGELAAGGPFASAAGVAVAGNDQKAVLIGGLLLAGILAILASLTVKVSATPAPLPWIHQVEFNVALFHRLLPHLVTLPVITYAVVAWACVGALWIVYLTLVWRTRSAGSINVRIIIAGAVLLSVLAVVIPSIYSSDVFSYAIFGKIASTYGINPYLTTANHAAPTDALIPYVFWRDIPSPYGPLWTLISQVLTFGKGTTPLELTLRFKVLGGAAVLLDGFLIYQLVKPRWPRHAGWAYMAFAWNPLVLIEGVVVAHNDALILSMVLVGAYVVTRAHRHIGFGSLVLSALIKYSTVPLLAVAALPALRTTLARKRPEQLIRLGIIAAVLAFAAFAPYWAGGRILLSTAEEPGRGVNNLPAVAFRFAVAGLSGGRLHASAAFTSAVALVVFAAWGLRSFWRRSPDAIETSTDDMLAAWAETLIVFLLLWPRIHTWYFLVPFGLAVAAGPLHQRLFWGIAVLSVLSYSSYVF